MAYLCFKCKKEVILNSSGRPGRKESCPHCSSDLHACKNCTHYELGAYNDCRENSADRVLEKDRSNFCDYFAFRNEQKGATPGPSKSDALKKLDDLFK